MPKGEDTVVDIRSLITRLIFCFIVAGVALSASTVLSQWRIGELEKSDEAQQEVINGVDVIQEDIEDIENELITINQKIDNLPAAMLEAIVNGGKSPGASP